MSLFNNVCLKISNDKKKTWVFILLIIVFNLMISFIFSSIAHLFFNKEILAGFENNFGTSLREQIFWIVLVAPFFETLLYQFLIIEIAAKRFSPFISCVISALIFGLSHTYNIFYFLSITIIGFLFAAIYYMGSITKKGIFYTFLAHAIYNAIALLLNYFKI